MTFLFQSTQALLKDVQISGGPYFSTGETHVNLGGQTPPSRLQGGKTYEYLRRNGSIPDPETYAGRTYQGIQGGPQESDAHQLQSSLECSTIKTTSSDRFRRLFFCNVDHPTICPIRSYSPFKKSSKSSQRESHSLTPNNTYIPPFSLSDGSDVHPTHHNWMDRGFSFPFHPVLLLLQPLVTKVLQPCDLVSCYKNVTVTRLWNGGKCNSFDNYLTYHCKPICFTV